MKYGSTASPVRPLCQLPGTRSRGDGTFAPFLRYVLQTRGGGRALPPAPLTRAPSPSPHTRASSRKQQHCSRCAHRCGTHTSGFSWVLVKDVQRALHTSCTAQEGGGLSSRGVPSRSYQLSPASCTCCTPRPCGCGRGPAGTAVHCDGQSRPPGMPTTCWWFVLGPRCCDTCQV